MSICMNTAVPSLKAKSEGTVNIQLTCYLAAMGLIKFDHFKCCTVIITMCVIMCEKIFLCC